MAELTLDNYTITNGTEAGCPTCRRVFASNEAFDAHRVGSYREGRKCAENLSDIGLRLNKKGAWRSVRGQ